MSHLKGKVALVTGASKGIGAAIARELAAHGAAVAVNYSGSKDAADKVVAAIQAAGGKAIAVQANLSDAAAAAPLVEVVAKQLGPINILVNNAGVYEFAPLEVVTPESFRRQPSSTLIPTAAASSTSVRSPPQAFQRPLSTVPPKAQSTPSR